MSEKLFILNLAKNQCQNKVELCEKKVSKLSDRLFHMDDSNSTVRRRAMERTNLSIACEERGRWENRIEIINNWIDEIKIEALKVGS
ncbi:hypothetical protein [Bacillus sp. S/N-304-OC-R1]|uniref:hypothetical protein n=1 Tax=Bacillus sp. S/N-304-OC-R1 TaxID=2758034 RepID=UPI001C8DC652|nr:hypothetical protein [Bacillus sp. S/N-304-OC-R1]MBY0122178.1 hypothetical protein [Bacillus sp. S/N-304-OC-R1]